MPVPSTRPLSTSPQPRIELDNRYIDAPSALSSLVVDAQTLGRSLFLDGNVRVKKLARLIDESPERVAEAFDHRGRRRDGPDGKVSGQEIYEVLLDRQRAGAEVPVREMLDTHLS